MRILNFVVLIIIVTLVGFTCPLVNPSLNRVPNSFGKYFRNYFSNDGNYQFTPFSKPKVTTISLIKQNGYPSEVHHVITEDGYILELHRIPYGLQSPPGEAPKIPVIIQHGTTQSSADWMINTPANNCLPLVLADAGYDVWLGNRRGNAYSNKHVQYSTFNPKFWNYSYHETGLYDIPATIDYVLEVTGFQKLQYIAYSEAPKNLIAGLSLRPEYNDKIGISINMGPIAFMSHWFNGYVRFFYPILGILNVILNVFGPLPLVPHLISELGRNTLPFICDKRRDVAGICNEIFLSLLGEDREQIDADKIQSIFAITPSPVSMKFVVHFIQEAKSGHYRQFDYGENGNMQAYGRSTPPDYDLSKVTVPISIIHGNYDHLAKIQDVKHLASLLPNVVDFYVVPWEKWTHVDYLYAKDARTLCYDHILELLDKYKF